MKKSFNDFVLCLFSFVKIKEDKKRDIFVPHPKGDCVLFCVCFCCCTKNYHPLKRLILAPPGLTMITD